MRRALMIGIAVMIVILNFGQSIVTTDKQWNNLIHYYDFTVGTEHIKFTSDTVINSFTYKKVERAIDEYEQNWLPYGYIRENTEKQIFYKIYPGDIERLLYDLNVPVHDTIVASGLITFYNNRIMDSLTYYVHHFDSVLIDQIYHKRINLTLLYDTSYIFEQWIDSLGSLGGMLHNKTILSGCDYYFLLCFFENGILKYHNPDYTLCHYWPTGVNENKSEGVTITISPNPITEVSVIEIKGIENYSQVSVKFFNLFGKEVWSKNTEKIFKIYKDQMPPGVYFYRISFNDLIIGSGKLIIL